NAPAGTAYAVFSARDLAGNRGDLVESGDSLLIDARGPSVTSIVISPAAPVKNDELSPVTVTVTVGLNEAMKTGELAQLSYMLSNHSGDPVVIDNMTMIQTQPGDAQTWQSSFELPSDAGSAESENLQFVYAGIDYLDNVGDWIDCNNLFQVYQGELPPPASPTGLTGESLPEGDIRLTWSETDNISAYQLFRQAPDETELSAYGDRMSTAQLEFIDSPAEEGIYIYAVAGVREENGQEAFGMSDTVNVNSDATVPGTPDNLALELVANGIK
ncbi:MAG: hypothetical protein GY867_05080, partial [bacterium]|nr:hypothetical protein [bacterium]